MDCGIHPAYKGMSALPFFDSKTIGFFCCVFFGDNNISGD